MEGSKIQTHRLCLWVFFAVCVYLYGDARDMFPQVKKYLRVHTELNSATTHPYQKYHTKLSWIDTKKPSLKSLLSHLPCVLNTQRGSRDHIPFHSSDTLAGLALNRLRAILSELSKPRRNTRTNCLTKTKPKKPRHWT